MNINCECSEHTIHNCTTLEGEILDKKPGFWANSTQMSKTCSMETRKRETEISLRVKDGLCHGFVRESGSLCACGGNHPFYQLHARQRDVQWHPDKLPGSSLQRKKRIRKNKLLTSSADRIFQAKSGRRPRKKSYAHGTADCGATACDINRRLAQSTPSDAACSTPRYPPHQV